MTEKERNEMRCLYRQAKCKAKQVKILQELYQVSRREVMNVLEIESVPTRKKAKCPQEVRTAAIEAVRSGETRAAVAKKFGVSYSTICNWVNEV